MPRSSNGSRSISPLNQVPCSGLTGRQAPRLVLVLSLLATGASLALVAHAVPEPARYLAGVFVSGLALSGLLFGITRSGIMARASEIEEFRRTRESLDKHAERLRILCEIDQALIAGEGIQAIAVAALPPLQELLRVPRAIVNLFDEAAGEVEWLAAIGRRRLRAGPGVRYPIRLMGDVEALRRGEPQIIDVHALPPGPEVEALLASGVHLYMAVPMLAGGELIGALSFGGDPGPFPPEQVRIAREVAMQLAIAIAQARLHERVKSQADDLELRVEKRTRELSAAHAELQRAHAELVQRTSELKAANQELESFSCSVSHDLRAPLRAIDGFSRLLEMNSEGRLDGNGRRLLSIVRESAERMGQMIDHLLEFCRFGRVTLSPRQADMSGLVRGVITEITQAAIGPVCEFDLAPLPASWCDVALVRQVWMNLVSNAVKYSGKRDRPRVEISGRVEEDFAVYCVKDNGAGFDMRAYDRLFKVFQRLHSETEFNGTGVGLAIVDRIVTRHGGKVWAESHPGEGASFYFSLPQREPGNRIKEANPQGPG